jgi:hypothetical protein
MKFADKEPGEVDFEEAIVACRPINPEQYDAQRKALWDGSVAAGLPIPPLYPGSIHDLCDFCGITIQIGPRQQAALKGLSDKAVRKLCLIDAAAYAHQNAESDEEVPVVNLGNPYQEPK